MKDLLLIALTAGFLLLCLGLGRFLDRAVR
jgi:hypothetical protein